MQFLAAAADDPRAPEARLDLAASYEALKERARAVDTLRRAAASRPGDPKPLQRLSDLQLRLGEWRSAIETLQASEARLPDTTARAALHLRIGSILRDLGRDAPNAAQSFRRAAELDPFSDGTGALVALYDAAGDARGGLETVMRELADIRRALAADPLDLRRAKRLAEYLAMARSRGASAPIAEAEAAVASVLELVHNQLPPPRREPWNRMRPFAPTAARAFWAELAHPAAGGFAGELWPHLVEAALLLFPPPSPRGRRATAAGAADPRFAWIEASAAALGVTGLHLYLGREPGPAVVAVEDPAPGAGAGARRREHVGGAIPRRPRAGRARAARHRARTRERRRRRAAVRVRGDRRGRSAARRAPETVGRAAAHGDARHRPQGEEGADAAGVAVRVRVVRSHRLARGGRCARPIGWA